MAVARRDLSPLSRSTPQQYHYTPIHIRTALGSVSSAIRSASFTAVKRFMRFSGPATAAFALVPATTVGASDD